MRTGAIRVRVVRGGETESLHTVEAVIVGLSPGEEVQFGDPETLAYFRSSLKPFQALTVVADGAAEAFAFDERDLALCCASHQGTPLHVERVAAMLTRLGLDESALACGPHPPFDDASHAGLLREGRTPGRLHNNCSGKHTGMLALALHCGWEPSGYAEPTHPVQRRIRAELRRWLDVDPEVVGWSVDGCGAPTPFVSLRQMARAYARLVRSDAVEAHAVVEAMTRQPEYVSGAGAPSTELMRSTEGGVLAKEGAEGVFCIAGVGAGWGAAFKVLDGGKRALAPAVIEALAALRLLREPALSNLERLRRPAIDNTRGVEVGRLSAEAVPRRAAVAGDL